VEVAGQWVRLRLLLIESTSNEEEPGHLLISALNTLLTAVILEIVVAVILLEFMPMLTQMESLMKHAIITKQQIKAALRLTNVEVVNQMDLAIQFLLKSCTWLVIMDPLVELIK